MADEMSNDVFENKKHNLKDIEKFYGMISDLLPLIRKFNNQDTVSYQKNLYSDKFFTLNLNIQQIM